VHVVDEVTNASHARNNATNVSTSSAIHVRTKDPFTIVEKPKVKECSVATALWSSIAQAEQLDSRRVVCVFGVV